MPNQVQRIFVNTWTWLRSPLRIIWNWLQKGWQSGLLVAILLILVSLTLIWLKPKASIPLVDEAHPHTLYLLSAIAQSLAAVLALVFTITLIFAQLSSQYSLRLVSSFFDLSTIAYILFFIVAILLPLWLLLEPNPLGVKLSISFAVATLLFLIPFFISFRDKLNPERRLLQAKNLALKHSKNRSKVIESVTIINDLSRDGFRTKHFDTFEMGVNVLGELIIDMKTKEEIEKTKNIWDWVIKSHKEGRNSEIPIASLRKILLEIIQETDALRLFVKGVGEGTIKAIEIDEKNAPREAHNLLKDLIFLSMENKIVDATESLVNPMCVIGKRALDQSLADTVWQILQTLEKVRCEALERKFMRVAEKAIESVGEIGFEAIKGEKFVLEAPSNVFTKVSINPKKEFVKWVTSYMATRGDMAFQNGLKGIVETGTKSLWKMGFWATIKEGENLTKQMREILIPIEQKFDTEFIESTLEKGEYWSDIWCDKQIAISLLERVEQKVGSKLPKLNFQELENWLRIKKQIVSSLITIEQKAGSVVESVFQYVAAFWEFDVPNGWEAPEKFKAFYQHQKNNLSTKSTINEEKIS